MKERQNWKEEQEEKAIKYRFGSEEKELTAEERKQYRIAEKLAEKIDNAGKAAAVAGFHKMTYKEFKRAFQMPDWVTPETYYFFSKSFYQVYCWGYEEGEKTKERQFDIKKEKKKSV